MPAGQYDIRIEQGATWRRTVTWSIAGTPVNLTGYTAAMQIKDASGTLVLGLTSTPTAGLVLGGAAGTVVITITAAQTATMSSTLHGRYDLLLTVPGGDVVRRIQGAVTVSPRVTS